MNYSTPGLPIHHQLPEFTQTHVHQIGDAIHPSHPLSSPSPPATNPSQHQGLFQWVNSSHEVAKVLEFQLQHQSFQWTPRTYLLQGGLVGSPCSPRDSQESSPAPQFKSINFLVLSFLHSPRISTFTLTISCLTTSNLPWFMDLTFQVPMQYCSLQHQTLLLSPVTSTTDYCLCFGSIPSFFLELFLHWSPVAYWAPTDMGSSSFSIQSFCLFILFVGFSRQEYWSGLPFPSPVDHILSDLSTMILLSWVAPHGMA